MAYLVLARKYRPQRFGEMTGQAHVVRTLSNALERGQLAHAFLFTGPRGVGKTTAARLVAKAVNCEKGPTAEPCGVCTPCVEIAEGRAVDVVEIDAASNNGVENVRDIVEGVKYRPARDRYKVFIVDEVHMLSQGAFNALLKTLEEPPPHVKFVLATTDVHRVPETIVSRCQRFDFKRLSLQQIAEQLGKVAEAEGMKLSPAALALVARQAEGGMRDALSLLDQVRAAAGDAPSDVEVAEALGAVDAAAVSRIGAALVARDGAAVLAELDGLHERGLETRRVAEEIVRHLRNVVVTRLAPGAPLDLPDAELAEVRAQAEGADPAQLTRLFDVAQKAATEVKQAEQPRYALEVALLKGVFLAPGADVAELIGRLEAMAGGSPPPPGGPVGGARAGGTRSVPATAARTAGAASPAAPPTTAPATSTRTATAASTSTPNPREVAKFGTPGCAAGSDAAPPHPDPSRLPLPAERGEGRGEAHRSPPPPAGEGDVQTHPAEGDEQDDPSAPAAARWRAVVERIERVSPLSAPALKQATLLWLREGEVAIQLPPGIYATTAERRRAEIEATFARHFGRPTKLSVTLGAPAAEAGAEAAAPSLAATDAAERQARASRVRDAARSHPNIREAAKILEGGIDKIEEL